MIIYAGLFNVAQDWILPTTTIQNSKDLQPLQAIDMLIVFVVIHVINQSSKLLV